MIKEFREFAIKGNMLDMAVGIIIGAAFGTVVSSFVNDILMPLVASVTGSPDFSDLFVLLKDADGGAGMYATLEAAQEAGAVTLNYGLFINAFISLMIVAFALFMVVRSFNKLKAAQEEEAAPANPQAPPPRSCWRKSATCWQRTPNLAGPRQRFAASPWDRGGLLRQVASACVQSGQ